MLLGNPDVSEEEGPVEEDGYSTELPDETREEDDYYEEEMLLDDEDESDEEK